jgi:hypothetical protein
MTKIHIKRYHCLLFMLLIQGLHMYAQTMPPAKSGTIVVRKKQNSLSDAGDRVTRNNAFNINNSEIKATTKRDPRYKGEPYVGKAEEVIVSVMDKNKKDFQYKYIDNALLLYGDFNTKTYKLYEIKSTISQKLYLHLEQKWYELKQNPKKTPLEEIDNPSLINYLNKQFPEK